MNIEPPMGQVVAFVPKRQCASSLALTAIRSYWESLREGAAPPRRSRIDARGIESALEFAFILERVPQGLARLRLAGQHLCDLAGMELRGMPLTSLIRTADRTLCHDATERAFSGPAIIEMQLVDAGLNRGLNGGTARLLILPLSDDQGAVSRALGALVHAGPHPQAPACYEILSQRRIALRAPANPWTNLATGMAEAQAPFQGPGRSHLQVVRMDHPAATG